MRLLRIVLVAALALPCSCRVMAQSEGGLGATLYLTDKPEKLFADWETPSPGVTLSSTGTARRGELIAGVIVFTACAPTEKGFCDVTVTYTLFKPDGTLYDEPMKSEVWIGKPPPPRNGLQLGVGSFCVVIEPEDPLGRYRMQAEVRDRVSGKTLRLERYFSAVEPPG